MNRILIIDDEPTIRMLLTRILELEGYEVLSAKDRVTALYTLKNNEVQVVLCDVFLPDGNGVDMVQELQQLAPSAKIILLTAHGNIPDGVQAIKNGAFDYIVKGDDNRKIIPIVSRAIDAVAEEQKKQAVAILTDIVYLVTTSHDKSVFDTCLSFFLTNRAIMLSEQTVISSVTHYADQTKINRIVQFYVVFTSLVESKLLRKRYTININHVRDVFNNKQLAEWLTDKR